MTIKEYFSKKQPINGTLKRNGLYKNVALIEFSDEEKTHCATISVARIGEDIWSLGWSIKDGAKPLLQKCCSPNVVTKGNISRLIYGMTKVLNRQLVGGYNTNIIREIVQHAMQEAETYCPRRASNAGKITI